MNESTYQIIGRDGAEAEFTVGPAGLHVRFRGTACKLSAPFERLTVDSSCNSITYTSGNECRAHWTITLNEPDFLELKNTIQRVREGIEQFMNS